jgi:hypothetical protein
MVHVMRDERRCTPPLMRGRYLVGLGNRTIIFPIFVFANWAGSFLGTLHRI